MIKKLLIRRAEKELRSYLDDVNKGTDEQLAIILGHSAFIYSQIIKKLPIIEEVVKEDIYSNELSDLVIQTNSLLKEYHSAGEIQEAAGVKLWNETFRCLCHKELNEYGVKIWNRFHSVVPLATNYLISLKQNFKDDDPMATKLSEALDYVDLVPKRYFNNF